MRVAAIGLSLRLARFELLAFGGLILALVLASVIAAAGIESIRPPAACFAGRFGEEPSARCGDLLNAWYTAQQGTTDLLTSLLVVVSLATGLFLGVPIVARELERGTSRLAWSLTPSRLGWYATRVGPVLVAVLALTYLAGVTLDALTGLTEPELDPARAFVAFGFRGVLIAARALFIFAIGVAAGAILGRALPALIVTAVVAAVGLSGGEAVHQRILRGEAVALASSEAGPGDLYVDQKFRLPDGSLVDYGDFGGEDPFDAEGNPRYPIVDLVVPGDRYRVVETREALVLAGGSLVALLLAAAAVTRRRPE
jgi:hypothetical protein